MKIKDRVFLITGAGSGLGAAVARMVVAEGGKAMLLDVNGDALASVAHELGAAARLLKTDVTSEADGQAAIAAARDAFGRIDGLVNCAGVAPGEKVVGRDGPHSLERFTRAVSINLVGTFNMIRLAAEAMSKQDAGAEGERGVIVNTASVAAFDGQIGQAAYAASKGGVVGMTLPIAREYAQFGIRVNTIAPGIFFTPMMHGLPQVAQESLGRSVPFPPRLGAPEEYAALAVHLIENGYMNGETVRIDGSLRMAPK